jgi:hypothetical protein
MSAPSLKRKAINEKVRAYARVGAALVSGRERIAAIRVIPDHVGIAP